MLFIRMKSLRILNRGAPANLSINNHKTSQRNGILLTFSTANNPLHFEQWLSLLPQLETTRHEPQINSRSDWPMIEGDCCICQSERSFFEVCHIILFDWLADNSFVLIVTEVGYGSWWLR